MAEHEEVVNAVVARLRELLPDTPVDELTEDRDLRDFAAFDSLGVLELLVWLEGRFSVSIPDEELIVDNFTTVGKMADYVVARSSTAVVD
ncbi:phosphopantetheine-binding protein [Micromonospora sp. HUAS YX12]|uniref:Phosphopantetheine-binding protein n=1 Tax=Micromonospora sp. HUAS YX12 TaxID=3156396 RepID=A0AAU7R3W2_9ACTN